MVSTICWAYGVQRKVLELFDAATSGSRLDIVVPSQFQSKPEGMFRITPNGERLSQVQLTNFQAVVTTNIKLDDGVETRREFEIEAEMLGQKPRFTISASEFAMMNWPIVQLGAAAITFPNQREYARTAIQALSLTAAEKTIYTHTGWRNLNGHWVYLHSLGAIGAAGAVSEVNVRVAGTLSRYELRPPTSPDALVNAVRASLRLLELGPPSISFPLLAATFRSVFGNADFSLHLAGASGVFKSELAALHQQHFGAAMTRTQLPAAWSSTANALEVVGFQAKDALLVVDDFAPQGNGADVARYHAAADRLFRAAGNQAGRSRLDSTAKLREPKPPRALVLSTGEEIPRGQSIRARLMILEISKGQVDSEALSRCQRDAADGLYAEAMGGFLQWMAGRHDQARAGCAARINEHRTKSSIETGHARTPEIVANLQAAVEMFLEFAVAAAAIDAVAADRLADRCWASLGEAAAAQDRYQGETEPATRFLILLRSLLASGRAHLAARNGGPPHGAADACGWRCSGSDQWTALGDCVGWLDDDQAYLEPTASFRAVQNAAREAGEGFAISEQTLRKRLREKDLLASVDSKRGTLTIRRSICGSSKDGKYPVNTTGLDEGCGT